MPDSDQMRDLGGMARRWLRAKKTELLTGNRREREQAEREAYDAQRAIGDAVAGETARSLFPALRRAEERRAQATAEADEQRRAEVAALPRVRARVTVHGAGIDGAWEGEVPVRAELDEGDPEPPSLLVELVPLDDVPLPLGGHQFLGVRLRVPGFHGPGGYDLSAILAEHEAAGFGYEAYDWELAIDQRDETYCWQPDLGAAHVEVRGQLDLGAELHMQSPSGAAVVTVDLAPG